MYARRRYKRKKYHGRVYGRKKRLNDVEIILVNIIAIILILLLILYIKSSFANPSYKKIDFPLDRLSEFNIPYKVIPALKELSAKYAVNFAELTAIYSLEYQFFPEKITTPNIEELEQNMLLNYSKIKQMYDIKQLAPYVKIFENIYSDLKYFPLPTGYDSDENVSFMYGDTWSSPRTYGGDRKHMGTDILDRENLPGRIPIVSMTGGYIQNMGWNELGGYYIGITSGSNNYYYYAHMSSFAPNLAKGSIILPGQLIGFMGNTGYSKKEGTTGNFATHLHVGILVDTELTNKELWINPYVFLRYIEGSRVAYAQE